jgi:hypothetical protein
MKDSVDEELLMPALLLPESEINDYELIGTLLISENSTGRSGE